MTIKYRFSDFNLFSAITTIFHSNYLRDKSYLYTKNFLQVKNTIKFDFCNQFNVEEYYNTLKLANNYYESFALLLEQDYNIPADVVTMICTIDARYM